MYQPDTTLAIKGNKSDHSLPLLSSSRKPTASAGKPGVAFGNRMEMMKVVNGVEFLIAFSLLDQLRST
jgi:hypothetical protein